MLHGTDQRHQSNATAAFYRVIRQASIKDSRLNWFHLISSSIPRRRCDIQSQDLRKHTTREAIDCDTKQPLTTPEGTARKPRWCEPPDICRCFFAFLLGRCILLVYTSVGRQHVRDKWFELEIHNVHTFQHNCDTQTSTFRNQPWDGRGIVHVQLHQLERRLGHGLKQFMEISN
jgi:hypothetical protein